MGTRILVGGEEVRWSEEEHRAYDKGFINGLAEGRRRGLLEAAEELESLHARSTFRKQVGNGIVITKALERAAERLRQRASEVKDA